MLNKKEYFCESIRQCESGMYAFALGIVKNENDAADVIQDAILKAYCNIDRLKDKEKFRPWIMKIVHNAAIDFLNKRYDTLELEEQEDLVSPSSSIDKETKMIVWKAIQQLKMPYRAVIILFYYEEYSVKQIAEITSTTTFTVRQQLSRGRKMLANLLKKEDLYEV